MEAGILLQVERGGGDFGQDVPGIAGLHATPEVIAAIEELMRHDVAGDPIKAPMLFSHIAPLGAFLVGFPEARERTDEIDRRLAGLEGAGTDDSTTVQSRRVHVPTTGEIGT